MDESQQPRSAREESLWWRSTPAAAYLRALAGQAATRLSLVPVGLALANAFMLGLAGLTVGVLIGAEPHNICGWSDTTQMVYLAMGFAVAGGLLSVTLWQCLVRRHFGLLKSHLAANLVDRGLLLRCFEPQPVEPLDAVVGAPAYSAPRKLLALSVAARTLDFRERLGRLVQRYPDCCAALGLWAYPQRYELAMQGAALASLGLSVLAGLALPLGMALSGLSSSSSAANWAWLVGVGLAASGIVAGLTVHTAQRQLAEAALRQALVEVLGEGD